MSNAEVGKCLAVKRQFECGHAENVEGESAVACSEAG